MNRLINISTKLYTWLLRLYPCAFRISYADEMRAVFRMRLADEGSRGWLALSLTFLHEMLELPYSIIREHLRKDRGPMRWLQLRGPQNVRRARNLTRAASLVVTFLVNWTLIQILTRPDYNLWSQSVPFVATLSSPTC